MILTKEGNITTLSVPNHYKVARKTLRSLSGKSGLTIEEFIEELKVLASYKFI
ncbi:MAG: hypothetical protein FJW69_10340 [Actinobacteria bacterium]|nr:hypothetical protein [Actinomycetota bacterium]